MSGQRVSAAMFTGLWAALGGQAADDGARVRFSGPGTLPSRFAVTDFARGQDGKRFVFLPA